MSNQRKPKQLLWGSGMTGFFGAVAFFSVYSTQRFESMHLLDIIRLMTAGAGLALSLFMLVVFFGGGPGLGKNSQESE